MEQEGYFVAKGLFGPGEVTALNTLFAKLHARGGDPGHYIPPTEEEAAGDIFRRYPRVMNPHRWMPEARRWLIEPRIGSYLAAFFGEDPLAAQSMYYFKPPGARGQSLHQDQFYLQVKPGTCIAAWVALDRVDRENGGLQIVPGTQDHPIDCINLGKTGSYEGGPAIKLPKGTQPVICEMEAGDCLFFNGSLIHGSPSNVTTDRWRRTFIGHYIGVSSESISKYYHPLVAFSGKNEERGVTNDGGPCGGYEGAAH